MTISKKISEIIAGSSFIRKMFEEGAQLKAEHGADLLKNLMKSCSMPYPPAALVIIVICPIQGFRWFAGPWQSIYQKSSRRR
jgi:hypothetical protein